MIGRLKIGLLGAFLFGSLVLAPAALTHAQTPPDPVPITKNCSSGPCNLSERIADSTGYVYGAWRATRSIINILLIIALLAISFSNITRINIDTYTVKKALPNLVIGVILANASFLIIRYMADIGTVATYLFVNQAGYQDFGQFMAQVLSLIGIDSIKVLGNAGAVIGPIVMILMTIVALIGILWLAFLLYFRLVAIYLLTILAPLAFVAYGVPGLEKYFKQWWQQFIKWLFILPAMCAVFWLIVLVGRAGTGDSVARVLTLYVLLFTALSIPSKFGGAALDKAMKLSQKVGKFGYQQSQNAAADVGLYGANLSKRGGIYRGIGKTLQGVGTVAGAPSSIQMGYKVRQTGKGKAREYFRKQNEAYKRFAGADNRFFDSYSKQKEDFQGSSATVLQDQMRDLDSGNEIFTYLQNLQATDPSSFQTLLTTPFNALKKLQGMGWQGDIDKMAKYLGTLKLYDTESRRRVTPNTGAGSYIAGGVPIGTPNPNSPTDTSNPTGSAESLPISLTADQLKLIEDLLKKGGSVDEATQGASVQLGLDPAQVRAAAADLEVEIKLRPHIDHFNGNFAPEESQRIAQLGAELGEDFDDAFESKSNIAFDQVITKGRDFLTKAGYVGSLDLSGKDNYEQAANMQGKIRLITRGAQAAASGQTANLALKLNSSIDRLGDQLTQALSPTARPEEQATILQESSEASQIINNHIVQHSQQIGKSLNTQEVASIGQKLKEGLVLELTNKRTLGRIFGSEKFRQTLNNSIMSANPTPAAAIPEETASPVTPSTPEPPAPTDDTAPPPPQ